MNDWLILIFFVDDIMAIYSSKDTHKMDEIESKLMTKYELRQLGTAEHFLGIRIVRDRPNRKLWLIQDSYIDKLADKYNISVTKALKTPIPVLEYTPFEGKATSEQVHIYQQRVGSANFAATVTRPDIAKAVSKLSEHLQNPSPQHLAASQQLLEYLAGTKWLAIQYDGKTTNNHLFLAYSDSAFADNILTRYSDYGLCFSLFGGIIDYKAIKGHTVTTSSTEAELLAISLAAKLFLQWLRFFKHLQFDLEEHPTILCDNRQTIRILTKEAPKLQTALKHVDIHQCWLRQEVQKGSISVEWVATADMVADGFTKLFTAQKQAEFIRQLNLVNIRDKLERSE